MFAFSKVVVKNNVFVENAGAFHVHLSNGATNG